MEILIAKANEVHYPMVVFGLGIQMHMAPQILKVYECYAYTENLANGIIAGRVQSNYLAQVMLSTAMQTMWEQAHGPTRTYLRTFVDDFRQSEAGVGHQVHIAMVERLCELAKELKKANKLVKATKKQLKAAKKNA